MINEMGVSESTDQCVHLEGWRFKCLSWLLSAVGLFTGTDSHQMKVYEP